MAKFKDRKEAGILLAQKLQKFKNTESIVLGLPRGGMVTASVIAQKLELPLGFLIVKKIGTPVDPELAIGAISEDGEVYFDEKIISKLSVNEDYKKSEAAVKLIEAKERGKLYRGSKLLERFEGKTVILVDDGIATGTTMLAGIKSARARGAGKVVVAVPLASRQGAADKIKREAELVTVSIESTLVSVGEFYDEFPQIEDSEVVKILNYAKNNFNN